MKQWHCSIGGQQYGPVPEEELSSWAVTGRVKPTDYVWSEGMTEAGRICGIIGIIINLVLQLWMIPWKVFFRVVR